VRPWRDLVRAREAAADDLRRKRQQLLSFLLRHSRIYSGRGYWTLAHQRFRLIGIHDRRHGPDRHDEGELLLETTQTLKGVFDRFDGFLKDNLLRSVLELLVGEPELGAERETTVDQALIRGLVTAFRIFDSGLLGLKDGRRA
jgi:hypothetical protein